MSRPTPHSEQFFFNLPPSFIELPISEDQLKDNQDDLISSVTDVLDLDAQDDDAAVEAAFGLAALGSILSDQGAGYAAAGFYRSPEDNDRPITILVTSVGIPSDYEDSQGAVQAILAVKQNEEHSSVIQFTVPAGHAVAVVDEEPHEIQLQNDVVTILQRQVTAWIPNPTGAEIALITVSTNSWKDWSYVCELALDIFCSISWTDSEYQSAGAHNTLSHGLVERNG